VLNTSRGKIVNTNDLLEALLSGKVGGACLDVFENEKPETYSPEEQQVYRKLFQLDQVVLSPHIAGWTHQSKEKIAKILIQKLDLLKT
jgi:D-3-phosphoglycerate dehydrogenase